MKSNIKKGFSILELLIVSAIITIALVSLLGLTAISLKTAVLVKETNRAKNIAEGIIEAVRNYRDNTDWNTNDPEDKYDGLGVVGTGVAYYPEKSADVSPKWMLISGEKTSQGFIQKIVFQNVSRDSVTDNIEAVYNPANNDPNTKKATATVLWKDKKIEIITYFTNWK